MEAVVKNVMNKFPKAKQGTMMLRMFGLMKIPLLWYLKPRVVFWDDERVDVPLSDESEKSKSFRKHVFCCPCCRSGCGGGLEAMRRIEESGERFSLAFKSFKASFLNGPRKM